jgi:peptidyl-tRNA hydrolase
MYIRVGFITILTPLCFYQKAANFILNMASSYKLTDSDINILVDNIAGKYGISKTRLSASYILSVNGSETTPNIYSVSITIAPSTGKVRVYQEIIKVNALNPRF